MIKLIYGDIPKGKHYWHQTTFYSDRYLEIFIKYPSYLKDWNEELLSNLIRDLRINTAREIVCFLDEEIYEATGYPVLLLAVFTIVDYGVAS